MSTPDTMDTIDEAEQAWREYKNSSSVFFLRCHFFASREKSTSRHILGYFWQEIQSENTCRQTWQSSLSLSAFKMILKDAVKINFIINAARIRELKI